MTTTDTRHGSPLHSSGDQEDTPWGSGPGETLPEVSTLHPTPAGWRTRTPATLGRLKTYFVPPSLLVDPPPSMAQLASYARTGAWTSSRKGFVRSLGVWWYRLALIPTAACRYAEWALQRPGRALALWGLWRLLYSTGGPAFHHFVAFFLRLAARVLL